jgi:hypothetical protein
MSSNMSAGQKDTAVLSRAPEPSGQRFQNSLMQVRHALAGPRPGGAPEYRRVRSVFRGMQCP